MIRYRYDRYIRSLEIEIEIIIQQYDLDDLSRVLYLDHASLEQTILTTAVHMLQEACLFTRRLRCEAI